MIIMVFNRHTKGTSVKWRYINVTYRIWYGDYRAYNIIYIWKLSHFASTLLFTLSHIHSRNHICYHATLERARECLLYVHCTMNCFPKTWLEWIKMANVHIYFMWINSIYKLKSPNDQCFNYLPLFSFIFIFFFQFCFVHSFALLYVLVHYGCNMSI